MEQINNLQDELKFFFRFLKENGIYTAYLRNIFNPKYYNSFQKNNEKDWTMEKCAERFGTSALITMLMIWDKTPEGDYFWRDKHRKLQKEFNEWKRLQM